MLKFPSSRILVLSLDKKETHIQKTLLNFHSLVSKELVVIQSHTHTSHATKRPSPTRSYVYLL